MGSCRPPTGWKTFLVWSKGGDDVRGVNGNDYKHSKSLLSGVYIFTREVLNCSRDKKDGGEAPS